jgi:hypothetical protein
MGLVSRPAGRGVLMGKGVMSRCLRSSGRRVPLLSGSTYDERYVEGWVEGCLERIGQEDPEEELLFHDLWDDETQREVVIDCLQADCQVRTGRPPSL